MSSQLVKLLPVAAALALGGLAHAATVRQLPSVVVKYGDLDLNTIDGVASLHARLSKAARDVCSQLDSRVLGLREQYHYCISAATAKGVLDINNANLTAYHRYGRKAVVASNG